MRKAVALAFCFWAASAFGQVFDMGDIVVVPDPTGSLNAIINGEPGPGSIFPSPQEQFCREAYNNMRASGHADVFDGVFAFTAGNVSMFNSVWQGAIVRSSAKNIGRDRTLTDLNKYNGRLISQCAFMASLQGEALPSNPDSPWKVLGLFESETGVEMLGHEYGHHWLMGIEYDLADGKGKRHLLRGTQGSGGEGGGEMGSPNQHYSALADARSVMYGSCLTDKGGGTWHQGGCPRKYNHIDQYLMGLRAPNEVDPMLVLEDPSDPGNGVDSIPMATSSSGRDVTGVPYMVTGESVVRAMGAREPAYPASKSCWRVAFIVVLPPGQTTLSRALYDKVERYRQRWSPWFSAATDGRGTMDTRVQGPGCIVNYSPDGGTYVYDAGQPLPDAGHDPADAGEPDAGQEAVDAGPGVVVPPRDAGPCIGIGCDDIGIIRPGGCGCGSASGFELVGGLALALAAVIARRRRCV